MIGEILLVGCAIGMGVCMFGLYVTEQTYRQRMRIIELRTEFINRSQFSVVDDLNKEYEAVERKAHARALWHFRDPLDLYGPVTRQLYAKAYK